MVCKYSILNEFIMEAARLSCNLFLLPLDMYGDLCCLLETGRCNFPFKPFELFIYFFFLFLLANFKFWRAQNPS